MHIYKFDRQMNIKQDNCSYMQSSFVSKRKINSRFAVSFVNNPQGSLGLDDAYQLTMRPPNPVVSLLLL